MREARSRRALVVAFAILTVIAWCGSSSHAIDEVIPLESLSLSAPTRDKPQSKVWLHDGTWWTVLPSTAVSLTGTWIWRLEDDGHWANVLHLSSRTDTRADTLAVGDVTHALLFSSSPKLVSLEYVDGTYVPWSVRPSATIIPASGETATIDVDSTGRMWLSSESGPNVTVYYSDPPYSAFQGPIILASDITSDDITVVTALPDGTVGVFWSNQNTKRDGFRLHHDGDPPDESFWEPDEQPASQSAGQLPGGALADDHMNTAVAADGTLYVATKASASSPEMILLVRRPNGAWDDLYVVDLHGTRPIVLLNEGAGTIQFIFTTSSDGGDIVLRESPISPIAFGPRQTLMRGTLNNATSTKMNWTDATVIIASGAGVLITDTGAGGIPTATATPDAIGTATATPFATATPTPIPTATLTPTATPTAPVLVLPPIADTYIQQGAQATWDHGAADHVDVDASPFAITYLKFDLSTVTAPVIRATLRLWCTNRSNDGGVLYPVQDSTWIEGDRIGTKSSGAGGPGLTWAQVDTNGDRKIDALDASPYVPDFALAIAAFGKVGASRAYTVDVTSALQGGAGTYTLAVRSASSDGARYSSRENPSASQRPVLHLELGTTP